MDELFSVAVRVAAWSESSVPAVAVNVAEVALAATLTDDGTVNTVDALLVSATSVLLVEELERFTVQVVLALDVRLAAMHCSEVTVGRLDGGELEPEPVPVTVNSSMMSSEVLYPPKVSS